MAENGIVIGLVALAVVCVGMIVLLIVLGGSNIVQSLIGILSGIQDEDEIDEYMPSRSKRRARTRTTEARDLDFDAAVERHRKQSTQVTVQSQSSGFDRKIPRRRSQLNDDPLAPAQGSLRKRRGFDDFEEEIYDDDRN